MVTVAEFKACFRKYKQKAPEDQDPAVLESLRTQSQRIDEQRSELRTRVEGLKKMFEARIDEVARERFIAATKTRSVSRAQLAEIEAAARRDLEAEKLAMRGQFEEMMAELHGAVRAADFLAGFELVEELEAMVSSMAGGEALAKLLAKRQKQSEKIATKLAGDVPTAATPVVAPSEVRSFLADHVEAQESREHETLAVESARAELQRLDGAFGVKNWLDEWLEDVSRSHGAHEAELVRSVESYNSARGELAAALRLVESTQTDIDDTEEFIRESEPLRAKRPETLSSREESTLRNLDAAPARLLELGEQLASEREAVQRCTDALPIARSAVTLAIDTLNQGLDDAMAQIRSDYADLERRVSATDADRDVAMSVPQIDLSGFRVAAPDFDADADIAVGFESAWKDIRIDADKLFPDLERIAGKHGTGRHGAQTGAAQQARRLATGGVTPDQPGHEWGTTRPLGDSVSWKSVTIRFETDGAEKRRIVDETVLVRDILTESRHQGASAASMFLNPQVEKEAVTRALAVVESRCPFTEVFDEGRWRPLNRIVVTVGPPKATKAIGYGHGIEKNDAQSDKQSLDVVNALLNEFRDGRLDEDELLRRLDVSFTQKFVNNLDEAVENGGAMIMPHCKVVLDRVGAGWSNTTQFPCGRDEAEGWSLEDKQVRVAPEADPVVAANEIP